MVCTLISIYFDSPQLGYYNKNKLYKTLHCWSRDMIILNVLENGLGLVSPPYFMYDFSGKYVSHVGFY